MVWLDLVGQCAAGKARRGFRGMVWLYEARLDQVWTLWLGVEVWLSKEWKPWFMSGRFPNIGCLHKKQEKNWSGLNGSMEWLHPEMCWRRAALERRFSMTCLNGMTPGLRRDFDWNRHRRSSETLRWYMLCRMLPNDQERGYVSIVRVLTNQEYTRQLLEEALSEFIALRKKYVMLVDLAELFQVIDDFQKKYFH